MITLAVSAPARIVLPNLDELPEQLARKFRAMDPRQLADIFNTPAPAQDH